jgi:photosystem II stability/assembly factor-like uncharacterized protein
MKTTLTTTIFILITQFCFAQDFWIQLNLPKDTTLHALAGNSEGTVFAATSIGVFSSFDNGQNWAIAEITNSVYRIIVDKHDRIFATIYPNIQYSINKGDSWNEIICPPVGIMTLHVNNNSIVFGNWGEIYKSSDFGQTWSQVLELSNTQVINVIIENPDGVLFAGVATFFGGGGVYRSLDNGDTWQKVGLNNSFITSLVMSSTGVLYAGSWGDSVFRSEDNGDTWKEIAYNGWVTSMAIDPNDVLYIGSINGVFRSADNGETWERIVTGMGNYHEVEGLTLSPDGYLYAYHNKLFRSAEPVFTPNSIPILNTYSVKIFPNPFTDTLQIELPDELLWKGLVSVNVYDPTGKLVLSPNITNLQSINLTALPEGLYYISIDVNGQRITRPIVKTS